MTTNDLYQERLLKWAGRNKHQGPLGMADAQGVTDNPLCGDRVTLEVRLKKGRVAAAAHQVRGCLLCKAAAEMLCHQAVTHRQKELMALREELAQALRANDPRKAIFPEPFSVFRPVGPKKSRHACVLLAFDAMLAALASSSDP